MFRLPVIFVCEDNNFAVHTPKSKRDGFSSISDIMRKFRINVYEESTTDVEKIYLTCKSAIDDVRESNKPCFLKFDYYRYLEHVGIEYDFSAGYRNKDTFRKWKKLDPLIMQKNKLIELGIKISSIDKIEANITKTIKNSISKAEIANSPDKTELYNGIYS